MYEFQNSINWHMYFFKPQVDVKVLLFQNMHLFQSGSLMLLNNSWRCECWSHTYMIMMIISLLFALNG